MPRRNGNPQTPKQEETAAPPPKKILNLQLPTTVDNCTAQLVQRLTKTTCRKTPTPSYNIHQTKESIVHRVGSDVSRPLHGPTRPIAVVCTSPLQQRVMHFKTRGMNIRHLFIWHIQHSGMAFKTALLRYDKSRRMPWTRIRYHGACIVLWLS